MTIADSQTLSWLAGEREEGQDSDGTLLTSPGECTCIVISPDPAEYVRLVTQQNREYELRGAKLLFEVVDNIRRLVPLEVDGETERLLQAAIGHQDTRDCNDLERWASRLSSDVKDADD